jgi:hypothetical protein
MQFLYITKKCRKNPGNNDFFSASDIAIWICGVIVYSKQPQGEDL